MTMVRIEKKAPVGLIRIDRPEAMNSLNEQVLTELDTALDAVGMDSDVRVIIITGKGKAFVAGADIAGMQPLDVRGGYEWGLLGRKVFRKIETMDKPVIAAVNGYALGGGC